MRLHLEIRSLGASKATQENHKHSADYDSPEGKEHFPRTCKRRMFIV